MKTKTLYLLIKNGGDGSSYIWYTFNSEWIQEQERRYDEGECDYECGPGVDGDGFHYDTLQVPEHYTLEFMGQTDCAK